MIDDAIEIPKISYFRFFVGVIVVLIMSALNLLQVGDIFGTNIWPFGFVLLMPAFSRFSYNIYLFFAAFALGLAQDLVVGQKIGTFGAINPLALGILIFIIEAMPQLRKNTLFEAVFSCFAILVAFYIFGLITNNCPNFIGLLVPMFLTFACGYFCAKYFEITVQNS